MFTGGAHSKKRSTSSTVHQKRYGITTQDKYCERGRLSYQEVTPLVHIRMTYKFLVIFRFDCVHAFSFL